MQPTTSPEPSGRTTLTPHEQAFVQAFLETGNAAESYKLAYPNASPKTPKKAGDKAYAIRQRPRVALAIEEAQRKAQAKADLSAEYVITRLQRNADGAVECSPPQYSASNHSLELLARKVVPEIGGRRLEYTGTIEHRIVQHPELTAQEIRAILAHHYQEQGQVVPAHWRELPAPSEEEIEGA